MAAPEFHLYLPQLALTMDEIVERGRVAERSGFDGLALMDHLAPPLADGVGMWEAMTTAAWLLARTERLTVGHLVLCDSLRHPALVAREAVTLDQASGSRFEVGLGWGSMPDELRAFGVSSNAGAQRAGRLAESLEVLRALWSGEPVSFVGDHFCLRDARQLPTPTRRIPIVIGGAGSRTLELVAAYADWWNLPAHQLGELAKRRAQVGAARISVQVIVALVDDPTEASTTSARLRKRFGQSPVVDSAIIGDAAAVRARLGELVADGVQRIYPWFVDGARPASIERFGEQVIRPLRAASLTA